MGGPDDWGGINGPLGSYLGGEWGLSSGVLRAQLVPLEGGGRRGRRYTGPKTRSMGMNNVFSVRKARYAISCSTITQNRAFRALNGGVNRFRLM